MAFIVFEGLDGSGKSTLMNRLSQVLKDQKIDHEMTREPGGTELAYV
jgi:dTMP kinase